MRTVMEDSLWLIVLAFIIVGLPALILKLVTIWFVRPETDKPRLRLLALSISGASLAGIVTILCYSALSRRFEFPAPGNQFLPSPYVLVATAAILVALIAAIEGALWSSFARRNGLQSIRTNVAWLFAGNAWILWAVWLMDQYRTMRQFD